jgi:hypothetical protein
MSSETTIVSGAGAVMPRHADSSFRPSSSTGAVPTPQVLAVRRRTHCWAALLARFCGGDVTFYDAGFRCGKARLDWAAVTASTVSFICKDALQRRRHFQRRRARQSHS